MFESNRGLILKSHLTLEFYFNWLICIKIYINIDIYTKKNHFLSRFVILKVFSVKTYRGKKQCQDPVLVSNNQRSATSFDAKLKSLHETLIN